MKERIVQRSLVWLIVGVLILTATGCGDEKKRSDTPREKALPQVKVKLLKKEPRKIWVEYSSKAEAYESATVVARVEGEILEQVFKAGQQVHKGDVLFHIDKSDYLAAYNKALAQLEKDRATLELAEADILRYMPLVAEQLAPRQKLEQLEAARKELEATIKADEVLVEDAKLKLSYCDVKAPIDGKIGQEFVKPGNLVSPGTRLASIVDSRKLQVGFFPSTREMAAIQRYKAKPFPDVEIYLRDNPAIRLTGQVEYIASRADETTGTVAMRARVANPDEAILPGSFVTVRLIIHDRMPVAAVSPDWAFQDQQGEFLYEVDADNTLRKVHFVSPFSNAETVILPDDLAGKRVLVQPAGSLMEGSRVQPQIVGGDESSGA